MVPKSGLGATLRGGKGKRSRYCTDCGDDTSK
jgi:hypothetical protein